MLFVKLIYKASENHKVFTGNIETIIYSTKETNQMNQKRLTDPQRLTPVHVILNSMLLSLW